MPRPQRQMGRISRVTHDLAKPASDSGTPALGTSYPDCNAPPTAGTTVRTHAVRVSELPVPQPCCCRY
ncbi:hypothetical protein GGTG_09207 [Gaeumannomyces tritici R3-111a-1]|uniref:Uncharacterized protein n=1 Tax=Gaeumannomyces tritici (strain R3-111a-1) TaxID=644352 RepID=J3P6R5_GAET3|nr:hypothetical protein GGTG_09207 [Gaeumannomyces tritici R3-111a-1]EJT72341.1 hypothetical protein GGTG_09207 [Gaeumannomyces tritici R3-111a-1]